MTPDANIKKRPPVAKRRGEVDIREAAELLECGYQTARKYIAAGKLKPRYPLGRGIGKPVLLLQRKVLELRDKLRSEAK